MFAKKLNLFQAPFRRRGLNYEKWRYTEWADRLKSGWHPNPVWSVKLILLFFVVCARCLLGIIVRTYFAFKTVVAAWLRDSSKDLISCRPTILLSPYRQYVVVHILPPLTACPEQPSSSSSYHDVAFLCIRVVTHG